MEAWDKLLRCAVAHQHNRSFFPSEVCDVGDASKEQNNSERNARDDSNAVPSTESSTFDVTTALDGATNEAAVIEAVDTAEPKQTSTLKTTPETSLASNPDIPIFTESLLQQSPPPLNEPLEGLEPEVPLAPAGYWSESPPELPRPYRSTFPDEAYDSIVHSDGSSSGSKYLLLGRMSNDLSDGLNELVSSRHGNVVVLFVAFVLMLVAASAFCCGRWIGLREGRAAQVKARRIHKEDQKK